MTKEHDICFRIQVFHCLEVAPEGGENLLVDGFSVAEQFKKKYPEGYAFFSSESFPSEYLEEGQHHNSLDTVFKHNSETGCLRQFRFVFAHHMVYVKFSHSLQTQFRNRMLEGTKFCIDSSYGLCGILLWYRKAVG